MNYLGLNISHLVSKSGLSKDDFGKQFGLNRGAIGAYVNGVANPKIDTLQKISAKYNVLIDDLISRDLTISDEIIGLTRKEYIEEKSTENSIPYFPDINASAGLDFLSENGHNYSVPISIPNVDAQAFINVFGDSMYPKYCSGEIIGIKEIHKDMVFFGHAYVIQMVDGEAYIKYIGRGSDDNHWLLRSENPAYEPKQFHLEKIRRVYIIKAVISKVTIL